MKKEIALLQIMLLLLGCGNRQENSASEAKEIKPTHVVGIGKVVPQGGVINLAAPVSGIVKEVHLKQGDNVKKGDLILALNNSEQLLSIEEVDSKIKSQQLTVESAKITVEQERVVYSEQLRLLNDAKELLGVGATTGENVRSLQSNFNQKDEELKKIENEYKLQQSQLNELKVQKTSRVNDLEKTRFTAPIDGILLDITPKVGEAVNLFQEYGRISPNKPLVVMVEIDELFADQLMLGQSCNINLPGNSEVAATGEITQISPDLKKKSLFSDSGTDLEDRRIREIEVTIKEINKTLFIESKVECTVQLN